MTLIRVSEFCRPSKPSLVRVTAIAADDRIDSRLKCSEASCRAALAWVQPSVLIALSALEGSFAWLRHGDRKVILRLYMISDEEDEEDDITEQLDVENDGASQDILLSPLAATNFGMNPPNNTTTLVQCTLESLYQDPPKVSFVLLHPLGRPPVWPRRNGQPEEEFWHHPAPPTLLQNGGVIAVPKTNTDSSTCFYQVVQMETDASPSTCTDFGLVSSSTTFELVQDLAMGDGFPRLPLLEATSPPPHPNIPELVESLQILTPKTSPKERILHVQGTDRDHDLTLAVETAAGLAGRTCWTLRGLAAFAYAAGHQVRTGSLLDQLAGLDAALQEIRHKRMEPVVLHLVDVDQELSLGDEPLRRDHEERIWSKLVHGLTAYRGSSSTNSNPQPRGNDVCPLIVILSSAHPLQAGPWLERLVFPSIVLSTPNQAYTEYLWKEPVDESYEELLRHRTVGEIQRIQRETQSATATERRVQIQAVCTKMDAKRRLQSSATVANVHWDDVGGLAHVRREIMDAIELPLKYPHLFPSSAGRSGILLYGPPGTGKTLVAKAVATECGLPFLSVKGPELLGSYVGESEANVRNVFNAAREAAEQNMPVTASILFFDELDSLAPKRGGVGDGGGVMERVVATLFAELDGDPSSDGRVFVMGATNRPDLLDPSLLRPGRLDRLVYLGIATDPNERARILSAQLHKIQLAGDAMEMSKAVVDQLPPRLTGADFSTIASGALLQAVHRLCREADEELNEAESKTGERMEMEQLLKGWGSDKCTPRVELDDLLEAAKEVIPSVSREELDRYERLRDQYSTQSTSPPGPVEHDGDIFY
eukprot:Nitzschia sp. Nitz4//scaffold15_size197535//95036//97570//NITZ4_001581-RA/size197535-augustus-gene-0.224-mRNA-1//-1//CDS//3329537724//405//frame0